MRVVFGVVLLVHGIAHLVGFVVPFRLVESDETPYRTTVLGGAVDLGDTGIRMMGVVWLLLALAFAASAIGLLAGEPWAARAAFPAAVASTAACVVGWPEARIGIVVNLALLAAMVLAPRFSALTFLP